MAGLTLLIGSLTEPAWAQEETDEPITLRVNTRLVQIDVIVTNDQGPVDGLTADRFTYSMKALNAILRL